MLDTQEELSSGFPEPHHEALTFVAANPPWFWGSENEALLDAEIHRRSLYWADGNCVLARNARERSVVHVNIHWGPPKGVAADQVHKIEPPRWTEVRPVDSDPTGEDFWRWVDEHVVRYFVHHVSVRMASRLAAAWQPTGPPILPNGTQTERRRVALEYARHRIVSTFLKMNHRRQEAFRIVFRQMFSEDLQLHQFWDAVDDVLSRYSTHGSVIPAIERRLKVSYHNAKQMAQRTRDMPRRIFHIWGLPHGRCTQACKKS